MEVKKIIEGMTATKVAEVIDENFNGLNEEKADKKLTNEAISKLSEYFFDYTQNIIPITGVGKTAYQGNVRKIGEIFFNTSSSLLRRCISYENPTEIEFETVDFDSSSVYLNLSTNQILEARDGTLVENVGKTSAFNRLRVFRLRDIADEMPTYLTKNTSSNVACMYDVVYKPTVKKIAMVTKLPDTVFSEIPPIYNVLYVTDSGTVYRWNGHDLVSDSSKFEDCFNVLSFVGQHSETGYQAGVRKNGDIFFNSSLGKMRRCVNYQGEGKNSTFEDVKNESSYYYLSEYDGFFYKVEGGMLVKTSYTSWIGVRDEILKTKEQVNNTASTPFDYKKKIIAITGIAPSVINGNVRKTGEVFFNTNRGEFRRCTKYVDMLSGSSYETVEPEDDAFYLNYTDNVLYKYEEGKLLPQGLETIAFNRSKSFRLRAISDEFPEGSLDVDNPNAYKVKDVIYSPKNKCVYIVNRLVSDFGSPTGLDYNSMPMLFDAEYVDDYNIVYKWNGDDLKPISNEDAKDVYDDNVCTETFVNAMRDKASKMGMSITIEGVAGFPDLQSSDGKSTAKLYAMASGYDVLAKIWNQKDDITIHSKGDVKKSHILHSSVYGDNDGANHWASSLTNFYDMLGGKTGTWGYPAYNLLGAAIKGPRDTTLIGWVRRNPGENQTSNRWHSMKILMDIAFALIENPSENISQLEESLIESGVIGAQVLKLPSGNILNYETFDFYKSDSRYENYNIYGYNNEAQGPIASNTKVLTAITALDNLSDLNSLVEIKAEDLVGGGSSADPEFVEGEKFTVKELLYAMMMPSSNTAARALARYVGEILIRVS